MRNSILKFLTVFVILLSQSSFAQNYTIKQIDSLILVFSKNKNEVSKEYSLKVNSKIIKSSKELNYSKGMAYGYYHIAYAFNTAYRYKDSFIYIDLANNEKYTKTDLDLRIKIYDLSGANFLDLGFYNQAKTQFKKEFEEAEGLVNNKDKKIRQSVIYAHISHILVQQNNDSFGYYLKKSYSKLEGINENDARYNLQTLYPNLIDYYSTQNKPDSLKYFVNKALDFLKRNNDNYFAIYGVNYNIGYDLHKHKKYDEALAYYLKALVAIKKTNFLDLQQNLCKDIARLYKDINNTEKEKKYLQEYMYLNDIINKEQKIGINETFKKVVKQNENDLKNNRLRLFWIIASMLFLASFGAFFGIRFHKKIQRKKEKIISNSSQALEKKKEIIFQKERETQVLTQKLNTAFEEVVELAKSNDPAFLARFQEVYPEFTKKLLEINPTLVASELKFCALLYFNFNLKDIAEYTFISTKTVQNRKNRIRKRLNIPLDKDINRWIKDLDNKGLN